MHYSPESIEHCHKATSSNDHDAGKPGHKAEDLGQEDAVRLGGTQLFQQLCNRTWVQVSQMWSHWRHYNCQTMMATCIQCTVYALFSYSLSCAVLSISAFFFNLAASMAFGDFLSSLALTTSDTTHRLQWLPSGLCHHFQIQCSDCSIVVWWAGYN